MTQLGYDARGHGQTAGTNVDGNESIIQLAAGLDAVVQAGSSLTFEATSAVEFNAIATEQSRLDTNTSVLTGDKFSVMVHFVSCPTPASDTWVSQIQNAADTNEVCRLILSTSRQFYLVNTSAATIAGPLAAVGAGAEVRINFSGDLSAQTANIEQFTTDPQTSQTPDASDPQTGVAWGGETDIGEVRFGVPHSAPALTYRSRYGVADDTTENALTPLDIIPPQNVDFTGNRLSWDAVNGATDYRVEKDSSVVATGVTNTYWDDASASAGAGHTYRVAVDTWA